jgi:hypothetical protein
MNTSNVIVIPQYDGCNSTVAVDTDNHSLADIKSCCQLLINKFNMRFGDISIEVEQELFKNILPSYNLYTKVFVDKNKKN